MSVGDLDGGERVGVVVIVVGVREGSEDKATVIGRRTALLGDGVVGKELGWVDGKMDGYTEGGMLLDEEGMIDGEEIEGRTKGEREGRTEGNSDGLPEGLVDGICDVVGDTDGACDGNSEGAAESQALMHTDLDAPDVVVPVGNTGQAKSGSRSLGH